MEKKKKQVNQYRAGVLSGILIAAIAISAAYNVKQFYENRKAKESLIAMQSEGAGGDATVVNSETISKIATIEEMVEERFYLGEVDEKTLQDGICRGMIESLGDKYAAYYTAEEFESQMEKNEGIYYGIGAYISIDAETELPYISGVIDGTPAQEAGLRMGDILYEVDGVQTFQMTLEEVTEYVKGDEGTTVTLTIIRDDTAFQQDVVRRKVDRPTVSAEMLEDDIGYIRITEFKDVTVEQFTESYAELKGSGAKALILDLRGNPGGLLDAVVSIGQQILPKGLIVYTEDKDGNRQEYTCDGRKEIQIPLAVLVDGSSASAAEILTGAVKDYGIGTIIGTKTYGKGIVQKIISLSDGSAVKLTTDGYFTPNGNNIHETGIEPDIVVEFDAEAYYSENPVDNQLNVAMDYLRKELEK